MAPKLNRRSLISSIVIKLGKAGNSEDDLHVIVNNTETQHLIKELASGRSTLTICSPRLPAVLEFKQTDDGRYVLKRAVRPSDEALERSPHLLKYLYGQYTDK